ncbi:hypothetical protein [Ilumatobacter coccineus]|uniref:hypothetical protein n=1 Tax=Ilumatobacter coccineus TaxID=467094 RepID=UPI00059CE6D3|nr:hypothetical protein [Ilumatobacter coccineus]
MLAFEIATPWGAGDSGADQSDLADRRRIAEQPDGQPDDVVEIEELDGAAHSPSFLFVVGG